MNLAPDINRVRDEYQRRLLHPTTHGATLPIPLLQQVNQYLTPIAGKMLRPRLTLLSAASQGESQPFSHLTLLKATAVEMLHNASLLHDDIIDNSPTRRGRPSVAHQWNTAIALLVGDHHLAQLMHLLDDIDDRHATRLVNATVQAMTESELMQQENLLGTAPLTPERYRATIEGKTARLFATACALGNPALEDFGLHFGLLFQLRDDLDDNEASPWTLDMAQQEHQHCLDILQRTLPPDNPARQEFVDLLQ